MPGITQGDSPRFHCAGQPAISADPPFRGMTENRPSAVAGCVGFARVYGPSVGSTGVSGDSPFASRTAPVIWYILPVVPPDSPPLGPRGKPMVPNISNARNLPGDKSARYEAYCVTARRLMRLAAACLVAVCAAIPRVSAAGDLASPRYSEDVQPILEQYCYGCHGLGTKKGGVGLDEFPDANAALSVPKLWHAVLKNLRSGIMPPAGKPQPSAEERRLLEDWIKRRGGGSTRRTPTPAASRCAGSTGSSTATRSAT